jgi:hypothetical protein
MQLPRCKLRIVSEVDDDEAGFFGKSVGENHDRTRSVIRGRTAGDAVIQFRTAMPDGQHNTA